MKFDPIRTEEDYETVLGRIWLLMEDDPEPSSVAGVELEMLCVLVEKYEEEKYPTKVVHQRWWLR